MCGITGFSKADGKSSVSNADRFMRQAVLAIENRGTDSTGYAWMNPDGQGYYCKRPLPAHEAVFCLPEINPHAITMIGHVRWATQGSKHKNENNHPVIDDGVMLVHNGVITNDREIYRWLDPDYPPKAEVDTAAFAAMLAHPQELFADHPIDLLPMVAGSNAFAWIMTAEPEVLHLARTDGRPLTVAWTRCGDLVMSSTPSTLYDLSRMAGVKVRRYREVEEGTYLKVLRGEIVEEQSFRPCKGYTYHKGGNTTSSQVGGSSQAAVGAAGNGDKVTYYVSNPGGVCTPVDEPVGGVVGDKSRDVDWEKARKKAAEDAAFWERVENYEEYWDGIYDGKDHAVIIDELMDKYGDDLLGKDDLSEDMIADAIERLSRHMANTRPRLTVITGEKGKTPPHGKPLPPYDYEVEGATTIDEEQAAYEQYLADMDEVDWYQLAPRRGWADRKTSAADDVSAALSREDR